MKILDRYILRAHVGPFCLGLLLTTGFLFTQVLRNYLDEFLAKGIALATIAEVFLLSLGHTLALSIPMAVLISTLMAFGQLAHDNEFTAFKAAGISLYRIVAPVLVASGLLCIGMIFFNDRILPESNHRLAGLITDIGRKKPTVNIQPGIFIDDFDGYQLLIGDKREDSDEIRDVIVTRLHPDRRPDLILAPKGRLDYIDGGNTLAIRLFDGEMHEVPDDQDSQDPYRVTRFRRHTVFIRDVDDRLSRTERSHRSDREKTVAMLLASIEANKEKGIRSRRNVHEQGRRHTMAKFEILERRPTWWETYKPPRPGRLTRGAEERRRTHARMEHSAADSYDRQIRSDWVEVHKKYAIPVACVVFVLLGAPLAIRSGHSGPTMAASLSIACFTTYYLFLTGGEVLADRRLLPPWMSMWTANIVFGVIGTVLTARTATDATTINWRRLDPRSWVATRSQRAEAL